MQAQDWSVPISALQHYLFCPRQCALIHLEQIWTENVRTAQGRLLHQRADKPQQGQRRGVRTVTAMPLGHPELSLHGVADVVEFHGRGADAQARPVEYKRGRPKAHRADEVQLCAQGLCLEHMLGQTIAHGDLYYGEKRRRHEVAFDAELRSLTQDTVTAVRAMFVLGQTPQAAFEATRCDHCSLLTDCRPQMLGKRSSVVDWLARQVKD